MPSERRSFFGSEPNARVYALLFSLIIFWSATSRAGNFYSGISPANVPWPGGVVPYQFTNTLTAAQSNTFLAGLREWELAANVKFVPYTNQSRWILFTYNTNFLDFVAGGYSPQVVTVSSLSRAQVCHEMGHSFGFTHENIRPDAANYIQVLTNNIDDEPVNIFWFTIDPTSVTNGNYDFESVMHLGWDFASVNLGVLATQQPKPPYFPRYQYRLGNYALSPGDRAALAYLYGPPAVPLTNLVTTTADVGPGSLRAAMYYATDHPGTVVQFNIPGSDPGYSNGVFHIHLSGQLPTLAGNSMVIDGSTQPGFSGRPLIVVDASQIIPETFTSDTFLIYSSSNQIRNISFSGFNWNGITLEYAGATNNTIAGCWIGLDSTGSNAAPNAYQGILIGGGASGNFIGGTNTPARNVISGNSQYGVYITDSNTTANVLLGNFFGTDAGGSNALANGKSGVIVISNASGNIIGGGAPAARNVISGNAEYGVYLAETTSNVISGNYIGIDAGGETALPNQKSGLGIYSGALNNLIGGTNAGARNVISGNAQYGLYLSDPGTSNNTVSGNFIGTDAAGAASAGHQQYGVGLLAGANANTIGGFANGAGNVISGNTAYGMFISDPGTSNNWVLGNYVGPDATGTNALGDGGIGIGLLSNASGNRIGEAGAGNVISGSPGFSYGIAVIGANGNLIQGNLIGTDPTGTNALPNGFANVALWGGSTGNQVGTIGAGNVIAFAGEAGVVLYDAGTTNNSIRGNSIFGNGHLGINFNNSGVVTNDEGDTDTGPDNLQNFPVITNVFTSGSSTIVRGTLNSLPDRAFYIDVYRNLVADPSGYGQGQFYAGTVGVTTDSAGNAPFALTASGNFSGQFFSSTATASTGDTSEFSADVAATNGPTPPIFLAPFSLTKTGFTATISVIDGQSYHLQAATNLAANPVAWLGLTNFTAGGALFQFNDPAATNYRVRFYRVTSP